MDNEKVGVGKLIGQEVKTQITGRIYKGFRNWAFVCAFFGIIAIFAGIPVHGGWALAIAVVLYICSAIAKNSFVKSYAKRQDVKDRFNKGE